MAVLERERTADLAPGSRHEEFAVAFFSLWAMIGLYLDGWAHTHDKPETFFSPWHGVLYSSVGAAVAYFGFREYILRRPSVISDRLLSVGFGIFGAGAGLDFAWHEVFGIEVDLEALLSPTHLMLLTGGLLMVSFPLRAAISRPGPRKATFRQLLPATMSLTISALLVQFFLQFFAAHRFGGLFSGGGAAQQGDIWQVAIIGSVFVTNAILMGATFIAVRRWDTPIGTFAMVYATVATGITGIFEFQVWQHIPAALLAGLVVDLLARWLRPSIDRRNKALLFGGLAAFFTWGLWLGAIETNAGIAWSIDLWSGTVYLATLEAMGLAVLAFPRTPAASESPAPGGPGVPVS